MFLKANLVEKAGQRPTWLFLGIFLREEDYARFRDYQGFVYAVDRPEIVDAVQSGTGQVVLTPSASPFVASSFTAATEISESTKLGPAAREVLASDLSARLPVQPPAITEWFSSVAVAWNPPEDRSEYSILAVADTFPYPGIGSARRTVPPKPGSDTNKRPPVRGFPWGVVGLVAVGLAVGAIAGYWWPRRDVADSGVATGIECPTSRQDLVKVQPTETGVLCLRPENAVVAGGLLSFNLSADALVGWCKSGTQAEWHVTDAESDTYDIEITYRSARQGTGYVVTINDRNFPATTQASTDANSFRQERIGTVALPDGDSNVVLRIDSDSENIFLQVRRIALVRRR